MPPISGRVPQSWQSGPRDGGGVRGRRLRNAGPNKPLFLPDFRGVGKLETVPVSDRPANQWPAKGTIPQLRPGLGVSPVSGRLLR